MLKALEANTLYGQGISRPYIGLYWYIALRSKSKVGEGRMVFNGISKVFSTKDNRQYETIGAFWDELSKEYGRENLRGLGYNWTTDTI